MNGEIYTFVIGLLLGFTVAWVVAIKWLFKLQDKKQNQEGD